MRNVRYGVLGASGIAQRRMLPAFPHARDSVLEAICSRSQEQASKLAKEFQAPGAFASLDEMLKTVDAVYVATPVYCHLDNARKILEAGKHLLLEKPLARTVKEAREILSLSEQSEAFAMEAYMMKFHPAHETIRDAVQSGRIGKIVQARARLGCWYPDMEGAWRQNPELAGGGALMDLGSHLIDLLCWMLGPIRSMRALCNTQLFGYAVEDSASVILEFDSGAHGLIEAYFSVPDQAGSGVLEIIGTQGRITAEETIGQNGSGTVQWELFPEQGTYDARQAGPPAESKRELVSYPTFDLYAAQLSYFSRCILEHRSPAINRLEDGVSTLEWIEQAYEAPGT